MEYRTWKGTIIDHLEAHEIFVFGSNLQGFHGAGAAGYASFGIPGNNWRKFEYVEKPKGWRGHWNIKGIGKGLQLGLIGMSYALPTTDKPGHKKGLTKEQIIVNIKELYNTARDMHTHDFLITYNKNKPNLNGYTIAVMKNMFLIAGKIPENIIFNENFIDLTKKKLI